MTIPEGFEGFRVPDKDMKRVLDLVKEFNKANKDLKAAQTECNKAICDYLENFMLPKVKLWVELNNKINTELSKINKKLSAEYAELQGMDGFDGDVKKKASNFVLKLRRLNPELYPDTPETIREYAGIRPANRMFGLMPKNPDHDLFMGKFISAEAPADTRSNVLKAIGLDDIIADDFDLDGLLQDIGERLEDPDLAEGLDGLSSDELAEFLSTLEDGIEPEELEKAIAKLEG